MNDKTIIEAVWHKAMAELKDKTSAWAVPISTELISVINETPPSPHGKLRCINIGVLAPFEIETLAFTDILFHAPDGVEEGQEYTALTVGPLLTWKWDNAQSVEEEPSEDSDDFSYELRAEAFGRGGMQAINDMSYSHDFGDCDMCGGHGCDRCDW